MDGEGKGGGGERRKEGEDGHKKMFAVDIQVITQYASTENTYCEKVTTDISIATTNASDSLVVVFFFATGEREEGSVNQ